MVDLLALFFVLFLAQLIPIVVVLMLMKFLLTICCLLFIHVLFASEVDTSFGDTSYTLYDLRSDQMVDTGVQFIRVEPERVVKRNPNDWMRGPVSGGPHSRGGNYDSIHNINPKVGAFISICFLVFVLYIFFRVRRSLRKDGDEKRRI